MFPRLILTAFSLALFLGGTVQAAASTPKPLPAPNEHPIRAAIHPNSLPTDQLRLLQTSSRTGVETASTAMPFLTRPYWGWHAVNSVFDHCLSSGYYVADNKICEVDGTVALKSNGVDPGFNLGYAVTPGGTNYLYYDGHNGWDLALNYETVIAAAAGVVTYAGWDSYGWGYTILIDHGNGFKTRYAHLSEIDVALNQSVSRGQRIAISGNSGNSTGAHLHFGVYRTDQTLSNGDMIAIDPWGWQASSSDPWPYDEGDVWLTGNPHDPIPDAPQNVTAASTCSSALVSWSAPAFDGGSGISSYTVKASPGGATQTVDGGTTQALFTGLTSGTSYSFTVVATGPVGTGPASTASNSLTAPASGPIDNACHVYTLSGRGSVQAAGVAPKMTGSPSFGFDIGRGLALFPDGSGGYELDGYGGMHPLGSAPAIPLPGYWPNWDIARSVALAPWSTASNPQGWVMDGFGGLHTFGGAPSLSGAPYWPGWDIAKQLVILPDSTPSSVEGYVLDGFGGLHPLGGAPSISAHAYWPGKNLARGVALLPGSTAAAVGGYTLDAYGGVHEFGNAPAVTGAPNWTNWDIARGLVLWNSAPAGTPGGWVLDGWGVLHAFGSAPGLTVSAYTVGADTYRGAAAAGSGNGGDGRPAV